MGRSRPEIINTVTGAIVAVASLVGAVGQLTRGLDQSLGQLQAASPLVTVAVSSIFFLVGIALARRGLSRKSRLLRPGVLLIDPDNPAHLKGRADFIRELCKAIKDNPLIFLEGESGAGKSALIRSGVLPALTKKEEATLLPLYMNTYGSDWETGPESQLVTELWRNLNADQRRQLQVETLDYLRSNLWPADETPGLLARIQNELGKTPLLVFDQFDDYQAQHRDRFLTRKGQWLNVKQLTVNKSTRNRFWAGIRQTLQHNAVRCLFITRSDAMGGMNAIEFIERQTYHLERLEPAYIIALLEEVVRPQGDGEQAVILHPECGWERLQQRLVSDLASQGRVLPIQARTALGGLIKLPYLSVATYKRAGRVTGLEAAHIEDGVAGASTKCRLAPKTVVQSLMELVDQTNPDAPKTQARSLRELVDQVNASEKQVTEMMDLLAQDNYGIVRRRVRDESAQDSQPQWSLYHDDPRRAVLAVDRKTERWQHLLSENLREWKQATDWREKWKAVLSPWEILRVLLARLSGHVRLEGYRGYLAWSTMSLLPYLVAVILLSIGGYKVLDYEQRLRASQENVLRKDVDTILATIGRPPRRSILPPPSTEEVVQLWKLAAAPQGLKDAFLQQGLAASKYHDTLMQRRVFISRSLFGLDPNLEQRKAFLKKLLAASQDESLAYDSRLFFLLWMTDICNSSPSDFKDESLILARRIVTAMQEIKIDPDLALSPDQSDELSALGSALGSLGENLPEKEAKEATQKLVEAMQGDFGWQKADLGIALGTLAERLATDQAKDMAKEVLDAIQWTHDDYQLFDLSRALGAFTKRLSADEAREFATEVLADMRPTSTADDLSKLATALGSLAEQLPQQQAEEGAKKLVEAMQQPTATADDLSKLGTALGSLAERLPEEQAAEGAKKLVEAIRQTDYTDHLIKLGTALGDLAEQLPEKQAEEGAAQVGEKLLDALQQAIDHTQRRELGSAFGFLAMWLSDTQAKQLAEKMLDAEQPPNQEEVSALVNAFGALAKRLTRNQAEDLAKKLRAEIEKAKEDYQFQRVSSLYRMLGTMAERLPVDQAKEIAQELADAMDLRPDLSALGSALGTLAERLPETQWDDGDQDPMAQGAQKLVNAMKEEESPYSVCELGSALASLGRRLPAAQAEEGAQELVDAMENLVTKIKEGQGPDETGRMIYELRELGSAFAALGERLPAAQAKDGAKLLVDGMIESTSFEDCTALAASLAAFQNVEKVDPMIVEWLKDPLAVGQARASVLQFLSQVDEAEQTTDQRFRDLKSFTDWAKKHHPELGLTIPPKNPFR